ncbi:MAG TPA: NAD(P)/FAD-dependent oxidoreductase [Rhizomicrobium sp.]|nr:NAD(P)/FAD-dependent oxidoreductase [Rhizomicrobium sp.]
MRALGNLAEPKLSRQEAMMESFEAEAVVIGAGAVGLAAARRLALSGLDVLILEKNDHPGMETSARNSEVIHAGIYYPQGSLKARLCVEGKRLLYDFCAAHGVPHRRLGKLIVGQAGQEAQLAAIANTAAGNGVEDLKPLSRADIAALEPEVVADQGLFSPSTGIIDSHQYMLALLGDLTLVRGARLRSARRQGENWHLAVESGGEEIALSARLIVNAAGLWAQAVAARIEGLTDIPALFLAKGNYAGLAIKSPFRHLVYPIPEPGGLGVHVTLDMGGRARFGPNVEWLASNDPARIDYTVAPDVAEKFAPVIASYWPGVKAQMLSSDYAGVRPKLSGPGQPNADFRIDGPQVHGLPGLVNLFGIESPGLTASLAIAEQVAGLLL